MSSLPVPRITPEEYVALEERSNMRHQYHDGQMFAMSGGSATHSLLCLNLGSAVKTALKGQSCRAYNADFRMVVPRSLTAYYPDLSIICGPPQPHPRFKHSATNPTVIFEVLSPSTASYDRGRKFEEYASIESLAAYVLVDQTTHAVDLFERQADDTWLLTRLRGADAILRLKAVDVAIPLAAIYDEINFAEAEVEPEPER